MQPDSVFSKASKREYTSYECEIAVTGLLLGGLPGDPHLMRGWLTRSAKKAAGANTDELIRTDMLRTFKNLGIEIGDLQEIDDLEELEERALSMMGENKITRFAQNGEGVCLESRNIQAAIKEAANIAFPAAKQWFSKVTGRPSEKKTPDTAKGLKGLIAEWVSVKPSLIPTGHPEPDIVHQIIKHTSNGSSLGLHEGVKDARLNFRVEVFRDLVPSDVWESLWVVGEHVGLGACRSMGYGRYVVTKWDRQTSSTHAEPTVPA